MTDALSNLKFEESGSFVKFKADVPYKLRVWSTNPIIHDNVYEDPKSGEKSISTKYAFAVWNFTLGREQILDAGATITKSISQLHQDEDYGADITKVDLKITPTGEMLERRYDVQVLPKPADLDKEQETKLNELDSGLENVIKNGIRAQEYNKGKAVPNGAEENVDLSTIFPE